MFEHKLQDVYAISDDYSFYVITLGCPRLSCIDALHLHLSGVGVWPLPR